MGRELIEAYPVFKKSLERFDACLRYLGAPFSLMDELHRDSKDSRLSDAELSQPGCTAIQLAMTDLLAEWAYAPRRSSATRAVRSARRTRRRRPDPRGLRCYRLLPRPVRARAQGELPLLEGGMLAVGAGPDDVRPLLKTLKNGKVVVACVNSPGSITASGDSDAITELASKIEEKQLFNRRVRVDTAYHSHHMELVADCVMERPSASSRRSPSPTWPSTRPSEASKVGTRRAGHVLLGSQPHPASSSSPPRSRKCAPQSRQG